MFDIDPPAPVLRLDDRKPIKNDAPASFPAQMDAYLADRWATLHAPEPAAHLSVGAVIYRLRSLSDADCRTARGLDTL